MLISVDMIHFVSEYDGLLSRLPQYNRHLQPTAYSATKFR